MQQVRAQELVATGYRYMKERNFDDAQDAFEQALELDPDNAAAQKGLRVAKTAQTMKAVTGVFRN
jgi:cytochrome c-type biogenesis protein CcmH/NrfG